MPRIVEIKLALTPVRPLIESVRGLADASKADPEVRILLDLFKPPFDETGAIAINEKTALPVLRASSFIRLQLRRGALAAIPDELIEGKLDANQYAGTERTAVHTYEFLFQVQEIVLEHFPASTFLGITVARRIARFLSALRRTSQGPDKASQVLVRNDPVNTLRYVALALQRELRLTERAATKLADGINQRKTAVVWQGDHAEADARVQALQAWHLDVFRRQANINQLGR
jgi:ATP-dependent Clp protease adapter protein ClpS